MMLSLATSNDGKRVEPAPMAEAEPQAGMHHITFRAMGCAMEAWVMAHDTALAVERLHLVHTWMAQVDITLSRFQQHSELNRLNAYPMLPYPVSSLLWDALDWALRAAEATGGLYDPTVLDALVAAGYDRDFDALSTESDNGAEVMLPVTGVHADWHAVVRDPMHRTVTRTPGVHLDLGGTAKGWAAARAAGMLAPLGPCLVNAGGDLDMRGALPGMDGWTVGVTDPGDPAASLALLTVRDRGVATSGVDYRRWTRHGVVRHHLIDPRTQQPAETDLLTATVIAPDAAWADLYALVVMVLGRVEGLALLTEHSELEGLLIDTTGHRWLTPGMEEYLS